MRRIIDDAIKSSLRQIKEMLSSTKVYLPNKIESNSNRNGTFKTLERKCCEEDE
jgi:hypothetical protein